MIDIGIGHHGIEGIFRVMRVEFVAHVLFPKANKFLLSRAEFGIIHGRPDLLLAEKPLDAAGRFDRARSKSQHPSPTHTSTSAKSSARSFDGDQSGDAARA